MKDGPFQGDLERAVLQVAGRPRKSNFERERKGFRALTTPEVRKLYFETLR
jgi:hypothetical protein